MSHIDIECLSFNMLRQGCIYVLMLQGCQVGEDPVHVITGKQLFQEQHIAVKIFISDLQTK